jgi:hypothetical protein
MRSKELFTCIAVLVVCTFACTLVSGAEDTPTPVPPTATEAPVPTDTPPPPEATPTEEASPTPEPVEVQNSPPVIDSVDLEEVDENGGMTVYMHTNFHDEDGDVTSVDYIVVSASTDVNTEAGSVESSPEQQKAGDTVTGTWRCDSENYEVTLFVVLRDQAGNRTKSDEFTIVCGFGVIAGGEFPDPFDDNRNGWNVNNYFRIEGGKMKARNIAEDESRWTYCETCQVSPENNKASVEGSWENKPNDSLGLLIDNGTCNPDGLVFVIGPHGYYAIIQAVRDDNGEWSHWRNYVDWVKSSLIRPAQNTPNEISAVYDFGDELRVSFFINGSYVMRVRVVGYTGSGECVPGLFAGGGLDANFDNFDITTP